MFQEIMNMQQCQMLQRGQINWGPKNTYLLHDLEVTGDIKQNMLGRIHIGQVKMSGSWGN